MLCISSDLPFAQARFCGAEGLSNVETLSTFRYDIYPLLSHRSFQSSEKEREGRGRKERVSTHALFVIDQRTSMTTME